VILWWIGIATDSLFLLLLPHAALLWKQTSFFFAEVGSPMHAMGLATFDFVFADIITT